MTIIIHVCVRAQNLTWSNITTDHYCLTIIVIGCHRQCPYMDGAWFSGINEYKWQEESPQSALQHFWQFFGFHHDVEVVHS